MKELILNIASIFSGVVGVLLGVYTLTRKIHTEKDLSKILKNRSDELNAILENELNSFSSGAPNLKEEQLRELLENIKQLADKLPTNERDQILESLEQRSSKGRMNYLRRLLSSADLRIPANV